MHRERCFLGCCSEPAINVLVVPVFIEAVRARHHHPEWYKEVTNGNP
jgi:cytochrome b subunit of formate dehydrogenase